jgi:Phage Mu protein F like protein
MPSIAYNRPFDEQGSFFKRKLNLPSERYDSIQGRAHDYGFMVAGAMQADLLVDLRAAIDKAINQGTGLVQFQKDFDKLAIKGKGWDYKGSRNWRTQVIYNTNLRSSYAAGRWAQMRDPDALSARPLWRYEHNDSVLTPRPEHQAWDGLILDATDAWWDPHYPPNGWGCQCKVVAIANDELADYNKSEPDDPPSDSINTAGIDEGWDYAPGQSAYETVRLAQSKTEALLAADESIARAYSAHLMEGGSFNDWYAQLEQRVETNRSTLKRLPEEEAVKWLSKNIENRGSWPVAILNPEAKGWLTTDANTLNFSTETALKQIYKRGQSLPADDYSFIQGILDNAQVVVSQSSGGSLVYFERDGKLYEVAIKATRNKKELYLTSYHFASERNIRSAIKNGKVVRDER